jgi:enoyl-CoA hydratase/3-hydroxyacyl-CoA dehydrogenase
MKIENLHKIAVIGAGDMGHGIAQMALMSGYAVCLCDANWETAERGVERIFDSLDKFLSKGKISRELVESIKKEKLKVFHTVEDAVRDADFVIEAVPEIFEIKIPVLREIDKFAPKRAVIASNTSTMSIQRFAEAISRPDKIVGCHHFNPVVMMRLVEVIRCRYTSDETAQFACDYVDRIGKVLVFAKKDTPGFIANRIFAPVIVYLGLCRDVERFDPMDIDISMMKIGQKMGPFELFDYTGIDVVNMCQDYYHEHLHKNYGPPICTKALVEAGFCGRKSGRGFYDWPEGAGRPQMDEGRWTGKFNPDIQFFLEANEATKLLEDGVCTLRDCDNAMVYGYNTQGPVDFIQRFCPDEIATALQGLADRYGYEIFAPTETIKAGGYIGKR